MLYEEININYSKTLDIKIKDVDLKEQEINLDEDYEGMAIVTLEVEKNDEYQQYKLTKDIKFI